MRRAWALWGALAVLAGGCGESAKPVNTEVEKRMLGGAADPGATPSKRGWAPGVEACYQKALATRPDDNHVVAIESGAFGPQLYDAYMLFWGSSGPVRVVRAHCPFAELDKPRWIEDELSADEGKKVIEHLGELGIAGLGDDDTVSKDVHGQGKVLFHVKLGSKVREYVVVAPWTLASANGDARYRDVLTYLLEVVPPQQ